MLIFIVGYFVFSLFAIFPINADLKRYWLIFFIVILALIAGFRGEGVDRDYLNYALNFQNLQPPSLSYIEPSFFIISSIIKVFGNNVAILFLIYSSISLFIKCVVIKNVSNNYFLSLLILISNIYIIQDLTQIRAAVGTSFCLLALVYLVDGAKSKFYIVVLIAILFHYTSILLLVFLLLDSNKMNKYIWLSLIPLSYIFLFLDITPINMYRIIPIIAIQSKIETYILLQQGESFGKEVNIFNSLVIIKYFLIIYFVLNVDSLRKANKYSIIFLKAYILSIVLLIITSKISTLSFRLNEYLSVVEIVLLPVLTVICRPKVLGYILVLLFSGFLMFLQFRAETLLIFIQDHV